MQKVARLMAQVNLMNKPEELTTAGIISVLTEPALNNLHNEILNSMPESGVNFIMKGLILGTLFAVSKEGIYTSGSIVEITLDGVPAYVVSIKDTQWAISYLNTEYLKRKQSVINQQIVDLNSLPRVRNKLPPIQCMKEVKRGKRIVRLLACLPNIEALILYAARVSSDRQNSGLIGLIDYLLKHKHYSPLELGNMVIEIIGFGRPIARQEERHKSMYTIEYEHPITYPLFKETDGVQEHSYRYSEGGEDKLFAKPQDLMVHYRIDDPTNRQASLSREELVVNPSLLEKCGLTLEEFDQNAREWHEIQKEAAETSVRLYEKARKIRTAKDISRNVLAEGMTPTKLVVSFNVRSFVTFQMGRNLNFGTGYEAQKEIQFLADMMLEAVEDVIPNVVMAMKKHCLSPFTMVYETIPSPFM